MDTFNVDKSSLHYRLASKYTPEFNNNPLWGVNDICSYTRAVMRGVLIALVIVVLCSFVGLLLVDFLAWLWVCLHLHYVSPDPFAIIFMFAMLMGAVLIFAIIVARRETTINIKPPAFITTAYYSFKDKYCIRVTYDGQNEAE